MALLHYEAGRFEDADCVCRDLLAAAPDDAHALHLSGIIALQRDDAVTAVRLIERAVAIDESPPGFLNNLGEAYRALDRMHEAEQAFRRALAYDPNSAGEYNNLAIVLSALGRFDEAEQCYRRAVELEPAMAKAKLNRGLMCLRRGDLTTGFALYESRYEGADRRQIEDAGRLLAALGGVVAWKGEDLTNQALLVWTEQGYGDSLMMLRYLPLLEARGVGRLVVYCADPLTRLVGAMPCVDEVVPQSRPIPTEGIDLHCSLMSLPFLFRTAIDSVPSDVPYLVVPAPLARQWVARLRAIARPRVGLVWAGGQRSRAEALRSLRFEDLAPLREAAGVRLVSLQKDADRKHVGRSGLDLFDAMDECHDFLDTAALVQQLDLVISIDTAVAHLAGALGRPVWLLNRYPGAWQWMLDRDDSPWYPDMRIFRQGANGDWRDVITRVAAALKDAFPRDAAARSQATRAKGRSSWPDWLLSLWK